MREVESSYVLFEEANQEAKKTQSQEERVKAILERDFDIFKNQREFALKNMHLLRGKKVPIEVDSIQSLPSHNCIIINDLLLMSFVEVEDLIVAFQNMEKKRKEKENGSSPTTSTDSGTDSTHSNDVEKH